MGRLWRLLCAVLIVPVCWALVPEISLKSINNHVQPNHAKSTDNDVISQSQPGQWPTLNLTRVKTTAAAAATSYNVTARLIDDNFDVVDPVPAVAPTVNTVIKDHAAKKKTRHRNKWTAKPTSASSVWSQNDILSATSAASLP